MMKHFNPVLDVLDSEKWQGTKEMKERKAFADSSLKSVIWSGACLGEQPFPQMNAKV